MSKNAHTHITENGQVIVHDHEHGHKHTHSHKETKAVLNRLSKIAGHINAIKNMVEDERDCSEVLVQLAAVDAAVKSVSRVILKDHISHCIVEAAKEGDMKVIDELNEALDKFLK